MNEAYFEQLLDSYITGQISGEDCKEFFSLLEQEDYRASLENIMQEEWESNKYEDAENRIMAGLIEDYVIKKIQNAATFPRKATVFRMKWWKVAAAAIVIALAGGIGYFVFHKSGKQPEIVQTVMKNDASPGKTGAILTLPNGQKIVLDSTQGNIVQNGDLKVINENGRLDYNGNASTVEYHTLFIPRGRQYKVQLPDSTEVWLNASSSITYPTTFADSIRKVVIKGEAYFEVAKNAMKPFIVSIDNRATVEVLGTHFNINAYEDEGSINTTLLEGSVKMTAAQKTVLLKPGQLARFTGQEIKVIKDIDMDVIMSWRSNSFLFNFTKLDEVLRQLSRWYDVDVMYEKDVPDIQFSGEIKKDLNLSETLTVLKKMGVNFKIEDKKLIVLP